MTEHWPRICNSKLIFKRPAPLKYLNSQFVVTEILENQEHERKIIFYYSLLFALHEGFELETFFIHTWQLSNEIEIRWKGTDQKT